MKTFISDIIPKIQRFSLKLDIMTFLTNNQWVLIDEIENNKIVYIFRQNNELLISNNGRVDKAKWEYLGHNSILIDRKGDCFLFKYGFFNENILALKIDSKDDEYAFLINENKYNTELNSVDKVLTFLTNKYIENENKKPIPLIQKSYPKVLNKDLSNEIVITSEESQSSFSDGDFEVIKCTFKLKDYTIYFRIHTSKYYYKINGKKSVFFNSIDNCLEAYITK